MKAVKIPFIIFMSLVIILLILFLSYGTVGYSPKEAIRSLGEFFLRESYNLYERTWWAASPEVVNAALWDYRGLDTVYETTVFYLAVIGCVTVFRLLKEYPSKAGKKPYALTVIVRTVSKIIFAAIILISAVIAFHGHVTPGGGFQAGSAFAIAPLMIIAAFSREFVEKLGLKIDLSHALKSVALLGITIIALIPLFYLGFILQNQYKPWGFFPGFPVGGVLTLVSGTIFPLNAAEFINIAMGFLTIFLIISIPEHVFKKEIKGGNHEP